MVPAVVGCWLIVYFGNIFVLIVVKWFGLPRFIGVVMGGLLVRVDVGSSSSCS